MGQAGANLQSATSSQNHYGGSWLLTLSESGKVFLKGVLRLEGNGDKWIVSGDLYHPLNMPKELKISNNVYYHFDKCDYYAYLYCRGAVLVDHKIILKNLKVYLWKNTEYYIFKEYIVYNIGLHLDGHKNSIHFGDRNLDVTLSKTSSRLRGVCLHLETLGTLDWKQEFDIPGTGTTLSITNALRGVGVEVSEHNIVDKDGPSTITLEELVERVEHSENLCGTPWHSRVLIVNNGNNSNKYGIMFDDNQSPERQGAAVFADALLGGSPHIKNPLSFLRTIIHEVGHILNLPEQSGESYFMSVSAETDSSSGSIELPKYAFHPYHEARLRHAPDPIFYPGWMPYIGGNVPSPEDLGLQKIPVFKTEERVSLSLDLADFVTAEENQDGTMIIPDDEYFCIKVTLKNIGGTN